MLKFKGAYKKSTRLSKIPLDIDVEKLLNDLQELNFNKKNVNTEKYIARRKHREEYIKTWREKNEEHVKEYKKEYNETHKEEIKEYNKKYHAEHREENRARCKKNYYEKKEERNIKRREWRAKNRERSRAYAREYYRKRKEEDVNYGRRKPKTAIQPPEEITTAKTSIQN